MPVEEIEKSLIGRLALKVLMYHHTKNQHIISE